MKLAIAQIIVSVLLVVLILLQERSGGLSSTIFGGGDSGGVYQTRRGLEKIVFRLTIVLAVAFVGLAVAQLLLV